MKYTQQQLCVLYLVDRKTWVRAVEMKGRPFMGDFLGSESDRRCYEIVKKCKQEGSYSLNGTEYLVEERRNGKFKEYRVATVIEKPKQVISFKEVGGQRIAVISYV